MNELNFDNLSNKEKIKYIQNIIYTANNDYQDIDSYEFLTEVLDKIPNFDEKARFISGFFTIQDKEDFIKNHVWTAEMIQDFMIKHPNAENEVYNILQDKTKNWKFHIVDFNELIKYILSGKRTKPLYEEEFLFQKYNKWTLQELTQCYVDECNKVGIDFLKSPGLMKYFEEKYENYIQMNLDSLTEVPKCHYYTMQREIIYICEMKYLYEYTNYLEKLKTNMKEFAYYEILEEIDDFPKIWPWLEISWTPKNHQSFLGPQFKCNVKNALPYIYRFLSFLDSNTRIAICHKIIFELAELYRKETIETAKPYYSSVDIYQRRYRELSQSWNQFTLNLID